MGTAKRKLQFRRNGTPPKKRERKPNKVKTPPNLPGLMTPEELDEAVKAKNKAWFARFPLKPPPDIWKETLKNVPKWKIERTIDNLYYPEPPPPPPLSDYERFIEKMHTAQMKQVEQMK